MKKLPLIVSAILNIVLLLCVAKQNAVVLLFECDLNDLSFFNEKYYSSINEKEKVMFYNAIFNFDRDRDGGHELFRCTKIVKKIIMQNINRKKSVRRREGDGSPVEDKETKPKS